MEPGPSQRSELARIALAAATSVDGVVRGFSGSHGQWQTPHPLGATEGVLAAAAAAGGFDLDLHLVARPVPLHALAADVRRHIAERARAAGLRGLVASVNVSFEDVEAAPQRLATVVAA